MKKNRVDSLFVPKFLKGTGINAYCVDYQSGKTEAYAHWHDCIEIIYIEKGKVEYFFNNEWTMLDEGTMLFIPPDKIHCLRTSDPTTEKYVFGFSTEIIYPDEDVIMFPIEVRYTDDFCKFSLSNNKDIAKLFWKAIAAEKLNMPAKELIQRACIFEIFSYIYLNWESNKIVRDNEKTNVIIKKIQNIITSDPLSAPGPYEMAAKLNISYSYMSMILKKTLNISYKELLNRSRIDLSKKLLLSTEKNVTEIGYDCGFCDSSYFIKIFKKYIGMSPNTYRNKNIKK